MQFRKISRFTDLPAGYAKLFAEAEKQSFFYGLDWFELLRRTALDSGREVSICALEDGPDDPRVAMVLRSDAPTGKPLESRVLSSFSNFYTMAYAPIVSPAEPSAAARVAELVTAVLNDNPRHDAICVGPMDSEKAMFRQVQDAFRLAGLMSRPYFVSGNWYEPVGGDSFEAYLARRPSQLRNTFRRRKKQLEKAANSRYVLTTGPQGLDAAIAAYCQVYAKSWKEPEQYPDFTAGLIRLCAAKGVLRLGVVYVDDVPAAAQIWLLDGDKAVIYKLAYDEQFKIQSIGTILTMDLMKHVIDVDRVREVDYGSGDDPYKKDWMAHRRERWGILAHNPRTLRGLIGGLAENARKGIGRVRGRPATVAAPAA